MEEKSKDQQGPPGRCQGRELTLNRSRTRDPLALRYGWHILRGRQELAHLRDLSEGFERWVSYRPGQQEWRHRTDG